MYIIRMFDNTYVNVGVDIMARIYTFFAHIRRPPIHQLAARGSLSQAACAAPTGRHATGRPGRSSTAPLTTLALLS